MVVVPLNLGAVSDLFQVEFVVFSELVVLRGQGVSPIFLEIEESHFIGLVALWCRRVPEEVEEFGVFLGDFLDLI